MSETDHELLEQFTNSQSQAAFATLVDRHLNLVFSAALRQVRSPELAREVAQIVFTDLAQKARQLKPQTVLSAWLYTVTRTTAIDLVRSEARRQAREQIAFEMSNLNEPPPDWTQIGPVLDEAMAALKEEDRAAILLRYFENKSLREVGSLLGASEDAAQKRVSRALEQLHGFLSRRGVAVGAGGLIALLSANAVQAAPTGLAATIAAGALLPSAAAVTLASASATLTKTIAMTTLQKTVVALVITGAAATAIYQTQQLSRSRAQVTQLQQERADQSALQAQVKQLEQEHARATNALAALAAKAAPGDKNPKEILKLRGEVGRLRVENASIASTNAISKVTSNPESRSMLRNQQKFGMGMLYKNFAKASNLSTEQTETFNDLLADHIMDNVDNVTRVLRDKPAPEEMDRIFAAQETALEAKVLELLGQDGLAQYKDYTSDLFSNVSADQFKGMLSGSDEEKAQKTKQFLACLQEQVRAILTEEHLPADYQLIPMLNFRNIASEQEGERSLKLLDSLYSRAASRAGNFLSPDELKKLEEFKTAAISNNRSALMLNRTLMAPISQ